MKAWKQKLLSDYIYLLVIVLFLYWIIVYGYPLFEYKRNSLIFCNGHRDVVGSFPSQYTFCCLPFCHLLQKKHQTKRNNGLMLRPKRIMSEMVWLVVLKCGIFFFLKIRDDIEPNNLQSN